MPAILQRPAIEKVHLDQDEIKKTIKITSKGYIPMMEIFQLMKAQGIQPDNVTGITRGQPQDPAVYVTFTEEKFTKLDEDKLFLHDKQYYATPLNSQVLFLRVHWLPLHVADSLVRTILTDFGKVIGIDREMQRGFQTGVRLVRLLVEERDKSAIPHMVKFECGTSVLITMQGRPPLCLRCLTVGHLRRDCPRVNASYANVLQSQSQSQNSQSTSTAQEGEPGPVTNDAEPPLPNSDTQSQPVPDPVTTDQGNGDQLPLGGKLIIDEDVDDGFMEVGRSSTKRSSDNLEEDVPDSFLREFPPQKIVKSAKDIQTSNSFEALAGLQDILDGSS